MAKSKDVTILRDLARRYAEAAADPIYNELRQLWRDHLSLRPTRVPLLATYGMWNVWCREVFGDARMSCADPFYRNYERELRMGLFHHEIEDDFIIEPWITVYAVRPRGWHNMWGIVTTTTDHEEGGSCLYLPGIVDWADLAKLTPPPHELDEAATAENFSRLNEALGDLLTVNLDRGPLCTNSDLPHHAFRLRGMEQIMIDMYDNPRELHALMAFLRDGALANQAAAEAAGDLGATNQLNQSHPYADTTEPPAANRRGLKRRQLWGFLNAQEFDPVGPAQHDEFLLQYQLPVIKEWGLSGYGCCEDLTHKIDMLRQIPNLRIIAVAPRADVRRCAEQIKADYVFSWRPSPAEQICCQFDEAFIRRSIREGLEAARGCRVHIHLKDIETVQGEPDRLARWSRLAREVADEMM